MRSIENRKKPIIIVGVLLLSLVLATIASILIIPEIKIDLNGKRSLTLKVGSEYEELGATAYYKTLFNQEKINLEILGKVDTNTLGNYTITYQAHKNNYTKKVKRHITVIDDEKPTIAIKGDIKACHNNNNIIVDATATDNYDGDITDSLKYKVDDDKITITVSDKSGNKEEIIKDVTFIDKEKPVIKLNGSKSVTITVGNKYNDAGVKATDSCDGDLSKKVTIEGSVDTSKTGTYELTYKVKDSNGSEVSASRTVTVKAKSTNTDNVTGGGTIYLTFDDGPGPYTTEILNTLDKYNIKATFFVTSQFSNYLDRITDEYQRGHTVGIHTYSHKWSIYNSVDTYLNDFNRMEQIVYEKTGVHSKYFRFPGGTSNEVSIKHCKGIMTTLSKLMPEKGYTYFDWNVDSCDTCKNNAVSDIINTIKTYVRGNGSYIILMHDIKKNTRDALPTVIEYLQSKGYTFKAIDDKTPKKQFAPHN